MKNKFILAACMAVIACACQPKAPASQNGNGNGQSDDQNFQDRRKQQQAPQRPQGGCCETEKAQAAPENQTAATPEVKVESAQ